MNEAIIRRLGNLLSVKSLVTLTLTAVFAVMAAREAISQDFMTIYAVIIAFYFGTQHAAPDSRGGSVRTGTQQEAAAETGEGQSDG